MRPLSATESISPAIARTKLILFTPFRKGRTWKLTATAYLCRIGTMFFPFPVIYFFFLPAARNAGTGAVTALVIAVGLLTALAVWIFHLCSRLQFAYFDIVLNRGEFVVPAWRKYGPQSRHWSAIKVGLGVALTQVGALPLAAYIHHLIPLFEMMKSIPPGQAPPPAFIGSIFAGYGLVFLIFGPFYLVSSLLYDFIVPSLALENTSTREAFRRMFALIRLEPGEFFLYVLLKLALGLAAYMGATLAWEIVFILCTVIVGLAVLVVGFLLHLAGVPMIVLTMLGFLLAFVWYLFFFGYTMFMTVGTVFTFLDAYALYFLGGRYPLLGDLLDRSTPPEVNPYAAAYSPYPPPYSAPQPEPPPGL